MLEKKLTQELDKKLDQNLLSFSQELESLVFGPLQKNLSILEKAVEFPFPTEKLKSNGEELISALNGLEELVRTITDDVFLSVESLAITEFLKSYNTELEKIISREEKSIRKVQSEERLLPQTGDIFTVRTGKLFKRLNYRTRKLLNKNFVLHKNIQHWQIIRFIYRNRMQEKLIPILENILPRSCSLHAEIRELLENLENHNIHSIGRYGSWNYTSMSDDVKSALLCTSGLNAQWTVGSKKRGTNG